VSDIDPALLLPLDHVQYELDGDIAFARDDTTTGRLRPAESQRSATGAVPMGLVANFADLLAGWASLRRAAPDRVATADMTISLLPMSRPEHLDGEVSVVRKGRSTMVSEVTIRDHVGVVVGLATATFTVLPQPEHLAPPSVLPAGRHSLTRGRREPNGSFSSSSGIVVDAPGRTSVAITPRVHNALRALNGGVIAALVDDAIASAGTDALGTPCHTTDLDIAYLSLGRVGPARAIATVLGGPLPAHSDRTTVEVEVVDEGAEGRVLTRASGIASTT
jgi:acyl-coenzyme A thioesterase PaaI-like protein